MPETNILRRDFLIEADRDPCLVHAGSGEVDVLWTQIMGTADPEVAGHGSVLRRLRRERFDALAGTTLNRTDDAVYVALTDALTALSAYREALLRAEFVRVEVPDEAAA